MANITAERTVPGICEARAEGYLPVGIGSTIEEAIDNLRDLLGDEIVPWDALEQLEALPMSPVPRGS